MDKQKLILLYLALFPFGQLPGLIIQEAFSVPFRIHLTDIVVIIAALSFVIHIFNNKLTIPTWLISGCTFVIIGLVGIILSNLTLNISYTIEPILYGVRILGYILFIGFIANSKLRKNVLQNALLITITVSAIFGWIQYLFFPDLTALKYFGWDDHYYRLVGTFLDPAFLGILLVFGVLLALWKKQNILAVLLSVTLAFTYSRASWVALALGMLYFFIKNINRKVIIVVAGLLLLTISLLPQPGGEGVNLRRTNSLEQKLVNYEHSLSIIEKSPVFGVGMGNVCSFNNEGSNSCYGLDNSVLFILATTGVIGLFIFLDFINKTAAEISPPKRTLVFGSVLSLLLHTMFTNTLFYPWVMGWMIMLWSIGKR